jgi:hypothetical protein
MGEHKCDGFDLEEMVTHILRVERAERINHWVAGVALGAALAAWGLMLWP